MKSVRFLLPLLLLLCTFSLCGCTGKEEKKIEDAVKQELDQLKNLDSVTTQKYISYQELFPGEPEDIAISSDIEEVFSLFFQDFDYKILDVNVDKDKQSAQANLRLVTLDAHALAEDFSKAQLKHEISQSASSEEATEQTISLEERYTLLDELLKSNDYQTVERNCTISLDASDKDGETSWEIRRTNTLENDLVGGLMNDLTDPDILSPEDTILVYLNTLKNMTAEELGNYLNADSIISTEDPAKIQPQLQPILPPLTAMLFWKIIRRSWIPILPLWMLLSTVPKNDMKSPTVCFLNILKKIQLLKQWKQLSH